LGGSENASLRNTFAYILGPIAISYFPFNPLLGSMVSDMTAAYSGGLAPSSFALAPNKKFAYTANSTNSLSQFAYDSVTGSLTPLNPPSVLVGVNPHGIFIDPTEQWVYVLCVNGTIYQFTIDSSTGQLMANGTSSAEYEPFKILFYSS
jgi:DNA-binding beta-propeller fold protein YncE